MFVRALKKDKKEVAEKEVKKEKRVIDDTNRHKPYGKTSWAPVDDVYIMRYYPRTIYNAADAVDLLKNFQVLDFTPHSQPVYIDLKLDMKLEKKVTASTQWLFSLDLFIPNEELRGDICSPLKPCLVKTGLRLCGC